MPSSSGNPHNKCRRRNRTNQSPSSKQKVSSSLTHALSAAKHLSIAMENDNNSSINDLSLDLIRKILLRVPAKSLFLLRCVCKSWLHIISDPNFAKSNYELSPTPTHRCLIFLRGEMHKVLAYDLDAVFRYDHAVADITVSVPTNGTSSFQVLQSCRGFVLLHQYPHFIIWNPLTGAHKRIAYSHITSKSNATDIIGYLRSNLLVGFGYDPSKDDYLVVLAWRNFGWRDNNEDDHFYVFSLRTNSWKKNLEVALPNSMNRCKWLPGLYVNGAIHWLGNLCGCDDHILAFDLVERSLSEIPKPEPKRVFLSTCHLMELGGCLTFYYFVRHAMKHVIWVMKEYKVQSSWTLCEIVDPHFNPVYLANGGDVIGLDASRGFSKYNLRGEKLEKSVGNVKGINMVYTESLLPLPNDSEEKKGM